MTQRKLEELSKEELIWELTKLEAAERRVAAEAGEAAREQLIHELQVHQLELEMQNRELREAQARLEEASSRYSDLYDFAPVGYCTLDPEGYIQEINLTGAALLGAPRGDLLRKSFTSAALVKDKASFHAHLRRCAKEKARTTSELAFRAGKRGARIVQLVSDPVLDEKGATLACRTSMVDISEVKALENRLRLLAEAGQRLALSLECTAALEAAARIAVPELSDVCMIDLLSESGALERKVVLFADPKKQAALAGRMMQLTPRPGWETPQARVIASGEPMLLSEVSAELRDRNSYNDGDTDPQRAANLRSLMVVPLNARGRTFGALTLASAESDRRYSSNDLEVAQDLASRVAMALDNARLYAEAQRAIAARDATLSLVSHDLRNLLDVILMRTALMLKSPPEQDRRAESHRSLEPVRRAAERMNRLIQDLLDAASIEAGRFSVERSPQPLGTLVGEVVEELQAQATAKSLRLTCDVSAAAGADVDVDRDRVAQVLSNLIGNAIKFTEPGGTIIIHAEPRDSEVCLSVTDTGPGIPTADLSHVFDRFWQAQKTARLGTGLGLSISRGIVEAHGGRRWVESQVGAGSTFFFTLPRARPEPQRPAPSEEGVRGWS